MAENLTRLKKSRGAQRKAVEQLIVKVQNFLKEGPGEGSLVEVDTHIGLVKAKETIIAGLNEKIWDVMDEKDIDGDVEECTNFELKLGKNLAEIATYEDERFGSRPGTVNIAVEDWGVPRHRDKVAVGEGVNTGVKLSKIVIKKFSGDPLAWQQFVEIFEATVDKKTNLSDIEKFSDLKGLLTGEAEKCIEGLSLTNDNYLQAWHMLKERFGNPQLICSTHMMNLLKVEKVMSGKNGKGLRKLYDQVESRVRALHSA